MKAITGWKVANLCVVVVEGYYISHEKKHRAIPAANLLLIILMKRKGPRYGGAGGK